MKSCLRCCPILVIFLIPVCGFSQMFWGVEEIPIEWPCDKGTSTSISSKLPTKSKSSVKKPKNKNIHDVKNDETTSQTLPVSSQKMTTETKPSITPTFTQLKGTVIYPAKGN